MRAWRSRWERTKDGAACAVFFAMLLVYVLAGPVAVAWLLWTAWR